MSEGKPSPSSGSTPGPWTFDEHGGTFYVFGPGMAMVADGDADEGYIARMRGVGRCATVEEQRANAAKIAAAPELLAVLKSIQFGADRRCPSCAGWMCGPDGETDNAHTDDCSVAAVIRKAEGHV